MKITSIIKTEKQYQEALMRIEVLMDAEPNTKESDELELLALLVEKYEDENYPLEKPDPIDVLNYYLEHRGLKAKDLVGIIGDKTSVSKILNKERKLNIHMIRRLHKQANIPLNLLIQEY